MKTVTTQSRIQLEAGELAVEIIGGELLTISSLRHRGVELLADPATLSAHYRVHSRRTGVTLLHPWANRLGADRFRFAGQDAQVTGAGDRITRDGNGLAIHGVLAPTSWQLSRTDTGRGRASLAWMSEPAFPFSHEIAVAFQLGGGSDHSVTLAVETCLSTLGASPVPVSVGWHPYFRCDRDAGAALVLPARSLLIADDHGLPTGAVQRHDAERIPLRDQGLDDGIADLRSGSALALVTGGRTIAVEFGAGYRYGQVFAPTDAPVVSLEPMTAPTDALCRGGSELPVAEPERPYRATFTLRVSGRPDT